MKLSGAIDLLVSPLHKNHDTLRYELMPDSALMARCIIFIELQEGYGGHTREEVIAFWHERVTVVLNNAKRDEIEKCTTLDTGYIMYNGIPVSRLLTGNRHQKADLVNTFICGVLGGIDPVTMGAAL